MTKNVAERQPEINSAQRAGLVVQNKTVLKGRWKCLTTSHPGLLPIRLHLISARLAGEGEPFAAALKIRAAGFAGQPADKNLWIFHFEFIFDARRQKH
ncbi:MAG TPA: hypothetical protein VHX90_05445 [Verrucomicrobiae bacterium]|nr:hypothetical protein [Verrucomicrobiae bacterium]